MTEHQPPRRLSCESMHADFHPDFARVGVRIDDAERNDVIWYDADRKLYRTLADTHDKDKVREANFVEPFFRYQESRQMRRARERWEAKHASRSE